MSVMEKLENAVKIHNSYEATTVYLFILPMIDKLKKSISVQVSAVVHPDAREAEIFAEHLATTDDIASNWIIEAQNEIMDGWSEEDQCQKNPPEQPIMAAHIKVTKDGMRSWPEYHVAMKRLNQLTKTDSNNSNQREVTRDLLVLGQDAVHCFTQDSVIARHVEVGNNVLVDTWWQQRISTRKEVGIELDYAVLQQAWHELFDTSAP